MIIAFQTLIYFRESLLTALDWLIPIWPYYKRWTLTKKGAESEDNEEEHVFADYDEEKGVVFYPPVYAQRYAAVADCLMDDRWAGKIQKVVDFGYNDMSFIKYLKDVPGIKCILGVDIESLPLRCSSDLLGFDDYAPRREGNPLQITLYQGNAADPDYRLIGCDAVVAIEMIEHMLPHDLERLIHTVFGFIKPQIAVFTTPNGDFNLLFKALEKNGLRRLDHFFEWSREQFHDWCSNIVARYPDYTVTCKGIGPGPTGTHQFGCCSQLAMFICKDYHKQQDLDINCLALVANAPKHNDLDEMTDSWESPDPITETNMLCAPDNTESYGEIPFSEKYSSSIFFSSEIHENIEYKDKFSQCNIEAERGKSFLMFDDEILCYDVLIPQRKVETKVYEFEDVASRLNCSTFQVKTFSKTTQNLMARNKLDSLVHTREIVDEIRHMTKMLNFNKSILNPCSAEEPNIWNNINWGENAPYWNQYYKIIKEYSYPFEVKSEECRILDLIYDEMNRLIDTHDSQFAVDANKLEIPLDHLMQVIEHLTDDAHKVKDLLEWNGYEIVDNVLIYSRLVDNASVGSLQDEWQDNDVLSDWDTSDVQSLSDASTIMPDVYGRSLRRALDSKLKKLRCLLTADEDITTELDKIVCRLMKLALHTSKDQQMPPPATWMQRKLLDLLSLTEKAIERRRKHFIENYPFKAIEYERYHNVETKLEDLILNPIQNDYSADKINDEYLITASDPTNENCIVKSEVNYTEENLSATSYNTDPFKTEAKSLYGGIKLESIKSESKEETRLEFTQGWVDGDYDVISPGNDYIVKPNVSSSNSNTSNDSQYRYERDLKDCNNVPDDKQHGSQYKMKKYAKTSNKRRSSKDKLIKKVLKKHSSSGQLPKSHSKKIEFVEYKSYTLNKSKMNFKVSNNLQPTLSKPIPRSLIELCYQDLGREKSDHLVESAVRKDYIPNNVAATKESLFIDIVAEGLEETFALRRSIATEIDLKYDIMDSEATIETVINVTKDDSFDSNHIVPLETVDSETIFLYDLNEPSTSKGIRHVSADAQCGTDIACSISSAVNSLMNLSNKCDTGIKISDSFTQLRFAKKCVDFGTITDGINCYRDLSLCSNTIKIKDSDETLTKTVECSTMTRDNDAKFDKVIVTPTVNVMNQIEPNSERRKIVECSTMTRDNDVKLDKVIVTPIVNVMNKIETNTERRKTVEYSTMTRDKDKSDKVIITPIVNVRNTIAANSELHVRSSNQSKSGLRCLKHPSESAMSPIISVTQYIKPKLSCCGIHVHSYRDRQLSEDVVFQGEWQKKGPTILAKKSPCAPNYRKHESMIKKKKVNSKERIVSSWKQKNAIKVSENRSVNKQNIKYTNTRQEIITKDNSKKPSFPLSITKPQRNNNVPSKVASKIVTSVTTSRSVKNICAKKNLREVKCNNINNNSRKITMNKKEALTCTKKDPTSFISNKLNKSADYPKSSNKIVLPVIRSKTKPEMFKNKLKFSDEKRKNITYLVFRNEIENSRSGVTSSGNSKAIIKPDSSKNNYSSTSQNSSPCSSPNSLSTVRALSTKSKSNINKRNSISPEKSNLQNMSENNEHCKTKRYIKSSKSTKMMDQSLISCENKENLPQTSKKHDTFKDVDKSGKVLVSDRNKNVFMLQVSAESPSSIPRKKSDNEIKTNSSSSKILKNKNIDNIHRVLSPSSFNKLSNKCKSPDDTSCNVDGIVRVPEINDLTRSSTPIIEVNNCEGHEFADEQIEDIKAIVKSSNSKINAAMKQIIEERLNFIKRTEDNIDSDSETIILSRDNHENSLIEGLSPISYKTVVTNENSYNISGRDIENALLNQSFESNLATLGSPHSRLPSDDRDLISFRSIESVAKCSQVLVQRRKLDNTLVPEQSTNTKTVRDLFERKDQSVSKNAGGALAVQVFSGFSMDGEPIVGDQPECNRLVDPETGNLTLEVARQTTSEELFVSGRSSDTYESCYVEDDTFLPNWLFHIISQQQSAEIPEEEQEPEPPEPLADAEYDVNGNILDAGFGVGVGAGDGHGMHSDQSQDSSGRGTSISSSDVSSGPQSEAILIEPSAFLGPGGRRGDAVGSTVVRVDSSDTSFRTVENVRAENDTQFIRETAQRRINRAATASDADADVSSLETDATDSNI